MTPRTRGVLLLSLMLTRCGNMPFEHDDAPAQLMTIDVAMDASEGSTGTPEALRETLDCVLPVVGAIPGSRLRVWFLGSDVATTTLIADLVVPTPRRKGARALRANSERFQREASSSIQKAAQPLFDAEPIRKRSPILEGIGKIAMAGVDPAHRHLVVFATDAREVSSYWDAECDRQYPDAAQLTARMQRDQILVAGSFTKQTEIVFAYVSIGELQRKGCPPVTLARAVAGQALFRSVLMAAGVKSVRFESGPPTITPTTKEEL